MGIDLDALEAAMREATPGPWTISECDDLHAAGIHSAEEKYPFGTTSANEEARLIVSAVNALPDLIAEIRELRADRERLDWLERRAKLDRIGIEFEGDVNMPFGLREVGWFEDYSDISDAATLRAAIDAARVHAEQGGAALPLATSEKMGSSPTRPIAWMTMANSRRQANEPHQRHGKRGQL